MRPFRSGLLYAVVGIALIGPLGSPSSHAGSAADVKLAREALQSRSAPWSESREGPLSGVYSACAALRLCGVDCSPGDYYSVTYVGSKEGSSRQELEALVQKAGATATVLSNLSGYDLYWLNAPLIANVRSSPGSATYDYWTTVHFRDGKLHVYDRNPTPTVLPMAEFLAIWSGVGVAVAPPGETITIDLLLGRLLVLLLGIAFCFCVWIFCGRSQTLSSVRISLPQFAFVGILTIALMGLGLCVIGSQQHLFEGIHTAVAPDIKRNFDSVPLQKLRAAASAGDALLIDSRYVADHLSGSIPGSVNIPSDASYLELRDYLQGIDRTLPVIVYCQSNSCHFSKIVADQLTHLGFVDVMVSEDGWVEFNEGN
jgi:rhodanese-related sulfurtransferase